MSNGMSDKERALIAAARRDLEKARAEPAQTIAPLPVPATPISASPMTAADIKRPDASAPTGQSTAGNTSPDAIAMRIAVLMEAERAEKARRLKSHQRWKTGAIGLFVALAGWWALTIISHLRH